MDKKSSHPPSSQHNLHRNYCGTNPTNPADLNLIAAALSLSGFCSQGHLIDTCEKSGYSRDETRTLITALVSLGFVELSVTQETPQVNVAICDDVELLEVVL